MRKRIGLLGFALGAVLLVSQQATSPIRGQGAPAAESKRVFLNVTLPADAKLEVDGYAVKQTGPTRLLASPPIETGKKYQYLVKITFKQDGKDVVLEKTVTVEPGVEASVDFTKDVPKSAPKKEEMKKEEPKNEAPKKEEPKKVEPKKEEMKKEEPKKEAPKKEEPKKEEMKKEEPKKEAPKKEEPKKEEMKKEAPKKEEPKKEEPKKEEMKKEAPKKEEPKKEEPKKEEPKKVDAKKEEMKKEEPKKEAPKKAEPKPEVKKEEPKKDANPAERITAPPKVVEPKKQARLNFSSLMMVQAKEGKTIVVPYVPTPQPIVDAMLKIANVKPADTVYDLGCGDGRIVISAVKKYHAKKGFGIDLNPDRIKESLDNAKKEAVIDQVTFKEGDVLELTDLSEASVVTMYLLPEVNLKLMPILQKTLKPGARVVSHDFDMGDWKPEKEIRVKDEEGISHTIYLWTIPPAK